MVYQKFSERQRKSPARRFLVVLGLVMFALYFFIGAAIIFWDKFPLMYGVAKGWKIAFGLLLIVYSFFRFVRLINQKRDE
ncbi:hypothetical protein BCY91_01155 [Pelobium manganitolerans]|uniref:Uncharacterized protein n=1 Tax=Pelobium manganitolerans TaxID=1842495 RepID=A0A419SBR4_9SPHI|nr:hypothetical protein BCY91_01155 [Pelobium manganitolerans]